MSDLKSWVKHLSDGIVYDISSYAAGIQVINKESCVVGSSVWCMKKEAVWKETISKCNF